MKRNDYPAPFEEVWQAYPTRPGANKRATFKQWTARIKAGVSAETMLAGARAYAAYIEATGQFLKAPETFFGPMEHYTCDWTPPEAAKKPASGAAWWLSDASRLAKAMEVGVGNAHYGESTASWEARIRAAIDNGGKPPAPPRLAQITMPSPAAAPTPALEQSPEPPRRAGRPEGLTKMLRDLGRAA